MPTYTDGEAKDLVNSIAAIHHTKPDTVDLFGVKKLVVADGAVLLDYDDPKLPAPTALKSTTLTGVVDYVASKLASENVTDQVVVHILSPAHVEVVAPLVGDHRQKFTYLVSTPILPSIIYGAHVDLEQFMIQLQSMFVQTDDQQDLLKFLGSVKVEESVHMADDGVGQTVTAKTGVLRTAEVEVRNPWVLAPFRTFPEIETPPSSPFILRMDKGAKSALFEADGGAWRVEAINAIRAYLTEKLPKGTVVIA